MSARERAAVVAAAVRRSPDGSVEMSAGSLAATFYEATLDTAAVRRIVDALQSEQLVVTGLADPYERVVPQTRVTVAVVEREETAAPKAAAEPAPAASGSSAPPPPVADTAAVVMAGASAVPTVALVGGWVLTAPLLLASATWTPTLIGFLIVAGGVLAAAFVAKGLLARAFFLPVKSLALAGILMTAIPTMLGGTAVAIAASPLLAAHREGERQDRAAGLVREADDAIGREDRERARDLLKRAAAIDDDVDGLGQSRSRLVDLDRAHEQYELGQEAEDNNRLIPALGYYRKAGDYSDSDRRASALVPLIAAKQLAEARQHIKARDWKAAISSAESSLKTRETKAAKTALVDAKRGLTRQTAAEAARRKAAARARAAKQAQERAARVAERERRRAAEAAAAASSGGGGYEVVNPPRPGARTCAETPGKNIPVGPGDPRDRDGDGIACEG